MKKLSFFLVLTLVILALACKNDAKSNKKPASSHSNEVTKKDLTEAEIATYMAKGKGIAQASFKALSGNLKKAMMKGGPKEAIQFCNASAGLIVDSLKTAHKASIKRTSTQLRNPANKPTPEEAAQLAAYEKAMASGSDLKPKVILTADNKVQFFAPIKLKAVCLKCHGIKGQTMKEDDYAVIQKLYPTDHAIGYKEGQLRGIWSIQFDR